VYGGSSRNKKPTKIGSKHKNLLLTVMMEAIFCSEISADLSPLHTVLYHPLSMRTAIILPVDMSGPSRGGSGKD
jgi:hypothetical protein